MRDAISRYLNAASGLTDLSRKRAQDLAQSLLASTGAAASGSSVAQQVGALAEELLTAARANREAVREMIREDVEIAVSRLGLVPASELAAARKKIARLESELADLKGGGGAKKAASARKRPPRAAVKKAAAKKAPAKQAPAKQAVTADGTAHGTAQATGQGTGQGTAQTPATAEQAPS